MKYIGGFLATQKFLSGLHRPCTHRVSRASGAAIMVAE